MVVPGSVEVRFRQSEVRHASPIPEPGRGYAPNTAYYLPRSFTPHNCQDSRKIYPFTAKSS